MPLRSFAFVTLALAALSLGGCATPRSTFGDVAVYSPAVRGYVVDPEPDRETSSEAVLPRVLVDPVTHDKLRCRDDVDRLKLVLGRAKASQVKMANAENWMIAWPLTYVFGVPAQPLLFGFSLTAVPYYVVGPRPPRGLYHDGLDAFRVADYRRASALFEEALLEREPDDLLQYEPRGDLGQRSRTLYYLGLAHEQLRENDRGVLALTRFTRHALRRDAEAYEVAEQRLARLGSPVPACASEDPVIMEWPK